MAFQSWQTWVTLTEVPAAELNQDIRDNGNALFPDENLSVDWTPTLLGSTTNPSTSATVGQYYRVGAMRFLWVRFVLSAAGSGTYSVALPENYVGIASGTSVGSVFTQDSGASSNNNTGTCLVDAGAPHQLLFAFPGGNASNTHPFTFASGDTLTLHATIPIA
jgi:hypothetical protein